MANSRYIPQRSRRCCAWCWHDVEQTRSDARYCSGRCRIAALRARSAAPPFVYTFQPLVATAPDDETLERLLTKQVRGKDGESATRHARRRIEDWLCRNSGDSDPVSEQETIDNANALAYTLRYRWPLVPYSIGAHPDDGERFDGRLLASGPTNARRWAYRAWLAELDDAESRRIAEALIGAAAVRGRAGS